MSESLESLPMPTPFSSKTSFNFRRIMPTPMMFQAIVTGLPLACALSFVIILCGCHIRLIIGRMERNMGQDKIGMSSMRLSETQHAELYTEEAGSHVILSSDVVEEYVMEPATALALLKWLSGMKEQLEQLVK
jgi:hypothetical protein